MFKVYGTIRPGEAGRSGGGQWLDRLQGEVGLDGMVLLLGRPGGVRLDVGPPGLMIERGSEPPEFRADPTMYAGSRCRPAATVSSCCAARDACAPVRASGLDVRVELAVATAGSIVEANPMFCCRNALGDRSLRSLCTMSADVRACTQAAIGDIVAALAPERVHLSAWFSGWAEADVEVLGWPRDLTDRERRWLRLCFCESCQQMAQSAGVEFEKARHGVREALLESLRTPREGSAEPAPHAFIESIDRYADWRSKALAAAWVGLARQANVPLSLVITSDVPGARIEDHPRVIVARNANELRTAGHGGMTYCTLRIPCTAFWGNDPAEAMGLLTGAAEAGIADVEIDRIALLRDADLDNLRKAIRFARRIS